MISHAESGDTVSAHIGQLRLRDLLLLDHVAATGSLRRAAQRMHVTQPAVTQALRQLEQAFGVALVERGRRGAALTPAGQAALARLRVARQELLAAQAAAQAPVHTTLRLGALPLTALSLVPRALARLRRQQPNVRVELRESTVAELWRQLGEGLLDAIVCRMPSLIEGHGLPAGVRCARVGVERMVLVARRGHPLFKRGRAVAIEALTDREWVLPPPGSFTRLLFDSMFVRAGLHPPEAVVTSLSFHTNLHLVAAEDWLTIAPESALRAYADLLRLRRLPVPGLELGDDLVMAWRESGAALPAVAALRDNLLPA